MTVTRDTGLKNKAHHTDKNYSLERLENNVENYVVKEKALEDNFLKSLNIYLITSQS